MTPELLIRSNGDVFLHGDKVASVVFNDLAAQDALVGYYLHEDNEEIMARGEVTRFATEVRDTIDRLQQALTEANLDE